MALEMNNATNARSKAGIEKLTKEYYNDIQTVLNAMDGQKYTELKATIRSYWQGTDCEMFIRDLDEKVQQMKKQIQSYYSKIEQTLKQENNNFVKFQSNNRV